MCDAVAAELRQRAEAGSIKPTERLALFEWYGVLKEIVAKHEQAQRPRPTRAIIDGGHSRVQVLRAVAE